MFRTAVLPRAGLATRATRTTRVAIGASSLNYRIGSVAMPLRAKMAAPTVGATREMHASLKNIRELEGDAPEDVVFSTLFGLRTIQLNRPDKLNALNASMIRKIAPRLREWANSDLANVVIIKGAGEASFCAGGDVTALAHQNVALGYKGSMMSASYFALEYALDHLIATYNKPYIAFMDGYTMGGGVGLSIHAPFRIATENTKFAMPETKIGFFPDVGGSFFLSRMPGALGTYLALTSDVISGANVFYAGIATHYLHSSQLAHLEQRLSELHFRDYHNLDNRLQVINETISEFNIGMPWDEPMTVGGDFRMAIDRCFDEESIEAIIENLKKEEALEENTPAIQEWASNSLKKIMERSPTALKVTLRMLRMGRHWDIRQAFLKEYEVAAKFMAHPDFNEGVMALLGPKEEKRTPKWTPERLEDVESKVLDWFFEPRIRENNDLSDPDNQNTEAKPKAGVEVTPKKLRPKMEPPKEHYFSSNNPNSLLSALMDPRIEPLRMWGERSYSLHPHRKYAVPTEREVRARCDTGQYSQVQLVSEMMWQTREKSGIKPVVRDIVARNTVEEGGIARWVTKWGMGLAGEEDRGVDVRREDLSKMRRMLAGEAEREKERLELAEMVKKMPPGGRGR